MKWKMPNITQNSQKLEFLPVLCMETPFDHLWHFGVITMAEAWMDRPVVIGCLILALDSFLSCGIFLSHFHGTNHIWIIRIWMSCHSRNCYSTIRLISFGHLRLLTYLWSRKVLIEWGLFGLWYPMVVWPERIRLVDRCNIQEFPDTTCKDWSWPR